MTLVRVACPQCGDQQMDPVSAPISLVKAPGAQIAVIYTCPVCGEVRRQTVAASMAQPVALLFRAAGRPLVMLPPQGDLPWPPLTSDDLIEFGLHTDEILDHLTMGETDG